MASLCCSPWTARVSFLQERLSSGEGCQLDMAIFSHYNFLFAVCVLPMSGSHGVMENLHVTCAEPTSPGDQRAGGPGRVLCHGCHCLVVLGA